MVFSSDSLSFDFPLDMRAAMEKAFALEESCGFGEEVYSMVRVLKTILNSTNVQSKPRNYFKLQADILVRIKKIAAGCYFQSGWDIVCRVLLALLHKQGFHCKSWDTCSLLNFTSPSVVHSHDQSLCRF